MTPQLTETVYSMAQRKLDEALENEQLEVGLNTQWLTSFGVDAVLEMLSKPSVQDALKEAIKLLDIEIGEVKDNLNRAKMVQSKYWTNEYGIRHNQLMWNKASLESLL